MIIEHIENDAYKTSGKLKVAQKKLALEAERDNDAGMKVLIACGSNFGGVRGGNGSHGSHRSRSKRYKSGLPRSAKITIEYSAQSGPQFDHLKPEKRAEFLFMQNFDMPDPELAAIQMDATSALNRTGIRDPIDFYTISWLPGEDVSKEQAIEVAKVYLEEAGYGKHQAIAYLHKDKDHLHLHITLNKVNPITFKGINDDLYVRSSLNQIIMDRVARQMEIKHRWTQVEGTYHNIVNDNVVPKTYAERRAISKARHFKQSSKEIQSERNSGLPTFSRWCIESKQSDLLRKEIRTALRDKSVIWHDIHRILDKYNLAIQPGPNNGYVIVDKSNESVCHLAASKVCPELSFVKLNRIIGSYQASAIIVSGNHPDRGYLKEVEQQKTAIYKKYEAQKNSYREAVKYLDLKYSDCLAHIKTIGKRTNEQIQQIQRTAKKRSIKETISRVLLRNDQSKREYIAEDQTLMSRLEKEKVITAIYAEADILKQEVQKDYQRERSALDRRYATVKGTYKEFLVKEVARGNITVKDEFDRVRQGNVRIKVEKTPVQEVVKLEKSLSVDKSVILPPSASTIEHDSDMKIIER